MIQIIKELNIEVSKPNMFQAVVAKQYDMNTRFIKATFVDNGDKILFTPSETLTVIINAERPDGESRGFDGVINSDGTVTVPLHSWMLELVGTVICDISVINIATDDNKKLTTTSFTLLVEKAAYGGDDISFDPQRDILVELIERVEKVEVGAVDQTYTPTSKNAQSGKAVAQALASDETKIINDASGYIILLTDSSNLPVRNMNVYGKTEQFTTQGKNLIPFIYKTPNGTVNGITFTVLDNGGVSLSGTATDTVYFSFAHKTQSPLWLPSGAYTYSFSGNGVDKIKGNIQYDDGGTTATLANFGSSGNVTFNNDTDRFVGVLLSVNSGVNVDGVIVYPLLESGTTPTEYEPYTGGMPSPNPDYPQSMNTPTDVQVKVIGKNLIPFPYITADKTSSGITFTVQNDGGVKVVGTATGEAIFNLCERHFSDNSGLTSTGSGVKTDGTIVISGGVDASASVTYHAKNDKTFIVVAKGATVNTVIYPQIEYGTTPTEYEPYTEQILTVPTMSDIGLAGVPVKEGGNYTDTDGQQWVCDEVDFARGVYVQRVAQKVLNGTETWEVFAGTREDGTDWYYQSGKISGAVDSGSSYSLICDQYPTNSISNNTERQGIGMVWRNIRIRWGTPLTLDEWKAQLAESPLTIQYVLAEPVEIPIDEAILSVFAEVHTNKPNTTITNTAGVWMSAEYVADTKLYIDNKFAELQALILEG